jgi:hypothetical protein
MSDTYGKGSTYEMFIGKAFNDFSRSKPGTHGSVLTNLIDSEMGKSNIKHLGSTSKLLINLKKYMHKAMDKFLKNKKLSEPDRLKFESLKNQIDYSSHSDELFEIIKETNIITNNI